MFALSLAGAGLFITPEPLSCRIHADAGFGDYLRLAWLVSSLATVGGALDAGLGSDVAVREAAYAYRPGEDDDVAASCARWSSGLSPRREFQ